KRLSFYGISANYFFLSRLTQTVYNAVKAVCIAEISLLKLIAYRAKRRGQSGITIRYAALTPLSLHIPLCFR
ncbi:MAG: hypothetical protein NC409_08950, partial [Clostridium sp.]|nr:hypothetical protein [Clostridium sp.]